MRLRFTGLLLAALSTATLGNLSASAEPMKLLVAADSSSGVYLQLFDQMKKYCGANDDIVLEKIENTGGAVGNLEAVFTNKANIGFLHSDVIMAAEEGNKQYADYKTLLALFPEDVHVLALRESKAKAGGVVGIGASTKEFHSLADLNSYDIGAAGGGVRTMFQLIKSGGAAFNPIAYEKGGDLLPALDAGKIHAVIFVGAAPLKIIEDLPRNKYKLLPIGDSIANRMKPRFRPTTVTYSNLLADQVPTVAPMATLVSRPVRAPVMKRAFSKLRQCFYDNLSLVQDTVGTHPKWREAIEWDRGVWYWLPLDGDQDPAPTK